MKHVEEITKLRRLIEMQVSSHRQLIILLAIDYQFGIKTIDIAKVAGIATKHVSTAIQKLKEKGLVISQKRHHVVGRPSYIYGLTAEGRAVVDEALSRRSGKPEMEVSP